MNYKVYDHKIKKNFDDYAVQMAQKKDRLGYRSLARRVDSDNVGFLRRVSAITGAGFVSAAGIISFMSGVVGVEAQKLAEKSLEYAAMAFGIYGISHTISKVVKKTRNNRLKSVVRRW